MTTRQRVKRAIRVSLLGLLMLVFILVMLYLTGVMITDMIEMFQGSSPEGRQIMGLIIASGIVIGLLICLWVWANEPD